MTTASRLFWSPLEHSRYAAPGGSLIRRTASRRPCTQRRVRGRLALSLKFCPARVRCSGCRHTTADAPGARVANRRPLEWWESRARVVPAPQWQPLRAVRAFFDSYRGRGRTTARLTDCNPDQVVSAIPVAMAAVNPSVAAIAVAHASARTRPGAHTPCFFVLQFLEQLSAGETSSKARGGHDNGVVSTASRSARTAA
jgi:hypothetical protein